MNIHNSDIIQDIKQNQYTVHDYHKPEQADFERGKTVIEQVDGNEIEIKLSTGEYYKGAVEEQTITGKGRLVFDDKELGTMDYNGDILNNKPNGYCELVLEDAKLNYKGFVSQNKVEGIGRLNSKEYLYYGQWLNNKFHGYGRVIKRDFALFEGLFFKNNRQGYGVEIYVNSDVYIGEFKIDKRNGLGTYFMQDGGFYYGFFKDNMRNGFGFLFNRHNRLIYKGFWEDDAKSGKGIEFYKNGSKYNGYFARGKRNGIGFMEYNQKLLYMGEWRDNKKHGQGKIDIGNKSIMGKFLNDEIVETCFVDVSKFADKINLNEIAETMAEYFELNGFDMKDIFIRGLHDLYNVIKESLVDFVLKLVEIGVLRLKVYILLKNMFVKASFETIIDEIKIFLRYEPNIYYLESLWEPLVAEIFRDKTSYSWNIWEIVETKKEAIFDEKTIFEEERIRSYSQKNKDTFVFEITKTTEVIDLVITNRVAKGEGKLCNFEGILNNTGFELRYFSKETGQWLRNVDYQIMPYFITMNDRDEKYMLSHNLTMFTGEFFFYNDKTHPLNLIMFLNFDDNDNIYSVSLDSIGAFVIAGEYDKTKKKGSFIQTYFQDYKIKYDAFLINNDKIQGYWSTTNISGHFVLRKNQGYKFSREVAALMEIILPRQLSNEDVGLNNIKELDILLDSSIISVIIKGKQGGIPQFDEQKKEDTDLDLFEKYKKKNEDESVNTSKQLVNTEDGSPDQDNDIKRESVNKLKRHITNQNRLTMTMVNKKKDELQGKVNMLINKDDIEDQFMIDENDFRKKLSKALKELKQVEFHNYNNWKFRFNPNSENITWKGQKNILGKEDLFVIDNLFLMDDIIEGVYVDEDDVIYELAGSCLMRTKEFEIIGLSKDKTKTLKIKGFLENFELKGNMSKRPATGPVMAISVKMFGYDGKGEFKGNDIDFNNLPCIIKMTDTYLYGLIYIKKDLVFVNGYKDSRGDYYIEISTKVKQLNNVSMIQVPPQNKGKNSNAMEKLICFMNEEMTLTIKY